MGFSIPVSSECEGVRDKHAHATLSHLEINVKAGVGLEMAKSTSQKSHMGA